MAKLTDADLTLSHSKQKSLARLEALSPRLQQLRLTMGGLLPPHELGPPVLAVFEGWDASGKGGAISRLVAPLDARHVRVAGYAAPSHDEKRHHFLHRFSAALPGWGGMTVMDRSWYGRVMVERVEGFATPVEWRRAYAQINEWEEALAVEGAVIVKFYLHISDEEQLRRFEKRRDDPLKQWKLTDEDWRNRAKRPEYLEAVEEMLDRTDTAWAPWVVVPAESKQYARVAVMERVIAEMERGLRAAGQDVPPPLS